MDINAYLAKSYGPQPCWELVADVYANELFAIPVEYKTVNRSIRQMASAFRIGIHKSAHGFVQIAEPVDFAIVFLSQYPDIGIHHCGVFYGGKVLHAKSGCMTMHEELSVIRDSYKVVEFWAK